MSTKTVRATVIDIRQDAPSRKDELFVDTNGWRNLSYTRIRNPKPEYLSYLKRALAEHVSLYACGVNLIEVASTIERDEWDIFKASTPAASNLKIYRHEYPAERLRVVTEVKAAWNQIMQVATLIEFTLGAPALDRCMATFERCPLDGYDLLQIEAMERRNVLNILTDDGDFAAVPGLTVFTANAAVIATARRQRMLVQR